MGVLLALVPRESAISFGVTAILRPLSWNRAIISRYEGFGAGGIRAD